MKHPVITGVLKDPTGIVLILLLLAMLAWRGVMFVWASHFQNLGFDIQIWGASYQILAFWGALCGLIFSRYWGGWKSVMGRVNIYFALGLCAELFGNSISSYYTITGGTLPYPSIADLGFFATIPLYTLGAFMLARAGGAKVQIRSFWNIAQIILIPVLMLCISAYFFLQGYVFDWTQPLKVFLDFGYPLGDAIYISSAILALSLTWRTLGGIMRFPILTFIAALVAQYAADFTFLYVNSQGGFIVGGLTDHLYLLAYFLMAASLIQLAVTFRHIKET